MQRGQVVLVDTNIIIEAVRTRCWHALTTHFQVETVEKCAEEARTGDYHRAGYVAIDEKALRARLTLHPVSEMALLAFSVQYPNADRLDIGERHLWAHALARADAWIATCADRAAVSAALALGWEERIVALESLAHAAGARPALKHHFTEDWLSQVRTTYKLDRGLK